jgi:threonylcarbamoyladenosine tRNA methylthiotransferase CDKAL1
MLEIYFETYGCTANYNSTEIIKGLIKQAGLNITENFDYSDLIIINSCIVKEPTQEKIRRRIQDLLKKQKKIILTGCMPRLNSEKLQNENLFLLDISRIKNIINLIQDIQDGTYNQEKYLKQRNEVKLNLPKISKEKLIGINQISEGCLGQCSYCIVKLAKGKLFSYPEEKIIESIKNDVNNGCKEIWITSQDNSAYGNEKGEYNLPNLLKEILQIKGNFFVRLGMMNPNNVLKILPELIEIYKNKKMFKFIHIPIQSGNDKILKLMKRNYLKKDIFKIINEFKKNIPLISISTDIIVGFPSETEKDFNETLNLIKEIKPEILNISKFWPRPNTSAEKLKQIPPRIKIQRATKLSKLHLEICKQNQEKYFNWEGKVLVDQKGFRNTYLARSPEYKLFAVQSNEKILGKIINVKVKKIMPHYLIC